jgi:hypothetical protein
VKHPDWTGRTAVVIANGPSLTIEQCRATAGGMATIAVNTAYVRAPDAAVFYAGDFLFHRVHNARMRKASHSASIWTTDPTAAEQYGVNRWKGRNEPGIGETLVHLNGNSGAQAINLAYLFGARKIVLLGFTMREIEGKKHFHGDHEKPLVQKQLFEQWLHAMEFVARDAKRLGVDVVNCDPLSAMTCFRRGELEDEL